jgi:hypothetical protein
MRAGRGNSGSDRRPFQKMQTAEKKANNVIIGNPRIQMHNCSAFFFLRNIFFSTRNIFLSE